MREARLQWRFVGHHEKVVLLLECKYGSEDSICPPSKRGVRVATTIRGISASAAVEVADHAVGRLASEHPNKLLVWIRLNSSVFALVQLRVGG